MANAYDDDYEEEEQEVRVSRRGNEDWGMLILGIFGGFIIAWFVLQFIQNIQIRIPAPDYRAPMSPYYSPYPYSPYDPCSPRRPVRNNMWANQTAQDEMFNKMTSNNESWDVIRDKEGNLKRINIHRKVRET